MNQAAIESSAPLTKLSQFRSSGRCPVLVYHLIFHNRQSLVDYGVLVKYGRRWLVDEGLFFAWLREHGKKR